MNISLHFTLDDALRSPIANRLGIDNKPNDVQLQNIKMAARSLEQVEYILCKLLIINSWFRTPALNYAIHGAQDSAHLHGFAIDFLCPVYDTTFIVANRIRTSHIKYDKLIHEFGGWVHISFDPQMRKQDYTIFYPQKKYIEGILTKEEYLQKAGV
jgi:hypothetical protein